MIRASIDGYVFSMAPGGGIARYWTEIIRASAGLELPIRFDVAVAPGVRRLEGVPFRTSGSIFAYWAAFKADIFHSTYYTKWPRMRCPEVATVYDFVDAAFPLLHPNREGFVERQFAALRRAAAVIAISKSTRDLAIELAGVAPSRIFLAYPAIAEPFTQSLPTADAIRKFREEHTGGAPYLIHVGHRKNYKNFRTILKAFCRMAPKTDRHLLIIGGKDRLDEDEIHWIIASRLMDRVHFKRHVDDATLRLAYAGADAMVHASLMEGFGIPVLEALACGTGLILSDIPVYREIAEGMATFVEAGDADAWAQAFLSAVEVQPAWREEVLKRYTWDAAAQVHLKAYECALK
jgi:glycosyltransferase involved in cell wall biosynthesis